MTRMRWLVITLVSIGALVAVEGHARARFAGQATASSGQDAYRALKAIDGDMKTRWGSAFSDNEWWQIAFDQVEHLAGLRIEWEDAYGEHYAIQVSDDGMKWQTVFEEPQGDGKTDWIFFEPVKTRFLRLQGVRRGTGWGYSIWELDLLPADDWPKVEAAHTTPESHPQRVVDGKSDTYWHAATSDSNFVTIHLPYLIELGGLELFWGPQFATSYRVEAETSSQWQLVHRVAQGNGDQDFIYFAPLKTQRIRLRFDQSHRGQGYSLKEIKLKSGAEQATPLRFYQALAQERPRGWYPRWLYREQEFWTITGVIGDTAESLLSESGVVEPYKGGFTVMPFLQVGDQLISWSDAKQEQTLEDDYLPLPNVTWATDAWSLHVSMVSFGTARDSSTAVRYRLTNRSQVPAQSQLVLALRPLQLNPKWQRGGFSPIRTLEAVPHVNGQAIRINGRDQLIATTTPSQVVALPFEQGTVLDCLRADNCPPDASARDEEGKTEAALAYKVQLNAGESQEFILVFPLHHKASDSMAWKNPSAVFQQHWEDQKREWQTILERVSISIPEPKLIHILRSNLAYILLNQDGPWIKPGPRNYNHSWMRDSSMTGLALLRLGITEPVRQYLTTYMPLVDDKGWVPWIIFEGGKPVEFVTDSREGHEYDSQGQFPFLVRNYVTFSGDERFLQTVYPTVVRALQYGRQLRRERMTEVYRTDPQRVAFYGLLPESNSHEGYYPAMHSYWDNFWYLRGLKDGIALAQRLQRTADAEWMRVELQEARAALYASMRHVIERDQLDYLPGSVEKGDFDATSTAIAIMVSEEAEQLPQPYARQTFERYYEMFVKRLVPGGAETFTPYEVRSAEVFVRLGQRQRALNMLRVFSYDSSHPSAWNHLAEVVHGHYRAPSYIGDMPHTWVGSGYISAVRSLFAYEAGDRLILAAGVDPKWLKQGVRVHDLPTQFGPIRYDILDIEGRIGMTVNGAAAPPAGFTVRLPQEFRTKLARLNGEIVDHTDASFTFTTLPITLELRDRETSSRDRERLQ